MDHSKRINCCEWSRGRRMTLVGMANVFLGGNRLKNDGGGLDFTVKFVCNAPSDRKLDTIVKHWLANGKKQKNKDKNELKN